MLLPQGSVEVLPCAPKCKKDVRSSMEKVHLSGKVCLGLSHGAVGQEFSVNESTLHIKECVFK